MVRFTIQMRLPSLMNTRMHWQAMARLKKGQRRRTKLAIKDMVLPSLPVTVTITRLGPRRLDDDNLQAACKYVRDEIAAQFRVDDGSPLYTWRYQQHIDEYGVEVEITPR